MNKPELKDHPIANIFPLMGDAELKELADDIRRNGLKQPIWIYQEQILDGRNRHRACLLSGVSPSFEHYIGDSPAAFVVSLNEKRRHLTPTQKSCCANDALPWLEKEAKERQKRKPNSVTEKIPEQIRGESRSKAAELFGANPRYVSDAKAIKEKHPEKFEAMKRGEKTMSDVKREIKREEHTQKLEEAKSKPVKQEIAGPFDIILADPPWRYEHCEADNREIENHYGTATLEDIFSHCPDSKDNSILFLWTTAPKLEEGIKTLNAWGFSYRSCAIWDKQKIGMGYWFRVQHEILLIGVRGHPGCTPESERISSIFSEPRTAHSKKPECVYAWIERAFPGTAKLEMYCRAPRKGWAVFGNEV